MAEEENHIKVAVERAGGATKVSNALSVSNGAVHSWIRKGRIHDIDKARKLASMSGVMLPLLRHVDT